MSEQNRYIELDKQVQKEIMAELEGKIVPHKCTPCEGDNCPHCGGSGVIKIQY